MWGNLANVVGRFLTQPKRDVLQMSWSLADPRHMEELFGDAGFQDIQVVQIRREDTIDSFDNYWAPIEERVGSIPQAYHSLDEADRHSVREDVHALLAQYEAPDGKLIICIETLIGSGRA